MQQHIAVVTTVLSPRSVWLFVLTTGWGTSLNLKAGLLNHVDILFVLDPYVHARVEGRVANTVDKASSFGDLQTRAENQSLGQ